MHGPAQGRKRQSFGRQKHNLQHPGRIQDHIAFGEYAEQLADRGHQAQATQVGQRECQEHPQRGRSGYSGECLHRAEQAAQRPQVLAGHGEVPERHPRGAGHSQ